MKKKEKVNYTVPILFLLYLALLIWIILFKLQFSILDLDRVREINLIPFYYEHEVTFHATEVLQNVLIFMPFTRQTPGFPRSLYIRAESFKAGAIFYFRHIASPIYIV